MSITFVAARQFKDFALLTRAFGVAVEGEFRAGKTQIQVHALENVPLNDMLIQLADSTRSYLTQKGITVYTDPYPVDGVIGATTVVSLGELTYYPHKALVRSSKVNSSITVLEY